MLSQLRWSRQGPDHPAAQGLKATGSRDLVLDDVFVPEHRCLSIMALMSGSTPGGEAHGIPLARLPFAWPAIWGIPASLIGMATGMAEAVKQTLVGKKALFTGEAQIERVANQIRLAEAMADIHAAELVMRHRLSELMKWGEHSQTLQADRSPKKRRFQRIGPRFSQNACDEKSVTDQNRNVRFIKKADGIRGKDQDYY